MPLRHRRYVFAPRCGSDLPQGANATHSRGAVSLTCPQHERYLFAVSQTGLPIIVGIRNLTCGFQRGCGGSTQCRIVAGQAPCAVSASAAAPQPDSGRFRALPARKARGWHACASQHFQADPRRARDRLSRFYVSANRGNSNSNSTPQFVETGVTLTTEREVVTCGTRSISGEPHVCLALRAVPSLRRVCPAWSG